VRLVGYLKKKVRRVMIRNDGRSVSASGDIRTAVHVSIFRRSLFNEKSALNGYLKITSVCLSFQLSVCPSDCLSVCPSD
jgi:hypothetical protein